MRLWKCDECGHIQESPLPFAVKQITDETDDDDFPIVVALHLCSAGCLCNFAMGLTLDYPDDGGTDAADQ